MRTIKLAATIEFGRIHSAIEKASTWPVSLLHHLLLVIIVSSKIPVMGRVCKESVKVHTPESPPPTYDSATDLAALSALTMRVLSRNTSAASRSVSKRSPIGVYPKTS